MDHPSLLELGVFSELFLCTASLRTTNDHREHGESSPKHGVRSWRRSLKPRIAWTMAVNLQALRLRHEYCGSTRA
jgi:hypothetical protein